MYSRKARRMSKKIKEEFGKFQKITESKWKVMEAFERCLEGLNF